MTQVTEPKEPRTIRSVGVGDYTPPRPCGQSALGLGSLGACPGHKLSRRPRTTARPTGCVRKPAALNFLIPIVKTAAIMAVNRHFERKPDSAISAGPGPAFVALLGAQFLPPDRTDRKAG